MADRARYPLTTSLAVLVLAVLVLGALVLGVVVLRGLGTAGPAALPAPPAGDAAPATPPAAPTAPPPPAVTVPLSLEGAGPRLVARVEIGGAVLRVLVDTGSSGLRVPAARVPPGAVAVSGPAQPYGYASGLRLTGRLARGPVRLGPASGAAVPLELVDTTSCAPTRPDCGAATGAMGGRLDGILGIGPQAGSDLRNPLWSFGPIGRAFALHADPGGTSTLTLGAPADGFVLAPLSAGGRPPAADGPPAWQPRVPMCVGGPILPAGPVCQPTMFDTGTPPPAVVRTAGAAPTSPRAATPVTFATPDGRLRGTAGAGERAAVVGPATTPGTDGTTTLGLPVFSSVDVRFDLAGGTLGLRGH